MKATVTYELSWEELQLAIKRYLIHDSQIDIKDSAQALAIADKEAIITIYQTQGREQLYYAVVSVSYDKRTHP